MRSDHPPAIRLQDYRVPDFLIDAVDLDIQLDGARSRVRSRLSVRRNPAGFDGTPLVLDGDELALESITLDGRAIPEDLHTVAPDKIVVAGVPERFTLEIVTRLDPAGNKRLMGLYRSNGIYCTQCEAEGFRRITYFPDRPDVLSVYQVRVEADKAEAPVLLANGNLTEHGDIEGGRHYAVWADPHPKPCYLFALVGGDLDRLGDEFTTASGRKVELGIYVERGKLDLAGYAMDSLKRSMRWDETAFGREYDLDVFNIVAVSDFNFGAMENKGLNIFNDKYVLASPETATDADYAAIEAVIAHEYFHNWTGNRITCRDWFQLCLKEGLTVFRDQEFSSDMRSRPVKRIADVRNLRAQQFVEDAGPLAHPVRPSQYREINNFYTMTVYEKGAELIRMLKTLVGAAAFVKGMDLYFERCDGTAATIEDFLACFAEASERDLSVFARWYEQAGTPRVSIRPDYDAAGKTLTLHMSQQTPPTSEQSEKRPVVIPLRLALFDREGAPLRVWEGDKQVMEIVVPFSEREQSLIIGDVASPPVISALRGFSAPVILDLPQDDAALLTLARHDTDAFNRWQALQTLAMQALRAAYETLQGGAAVQAPSALIEAAGSVLADANADHAFAALSLAIPGETELAREIGRDVDPDAAYAARKAVRRALGQAHFNAIQALHGHLTMDEAYSPDAASAGRRALRNALLDLLAAGDPETGATLAAGEFESAGNMTDRLAALGTLCSSADARREAALAAFETRFRSEALALDKWFGLQATIPEAGTINRVRDLMRHPAFSLANPNRTRALVGSFAGGNPTQFHRADGAGYALVADVVREVDRSNPQVAARLLTAFRTWRTLEASRRAQAEATLRSIAGGQTLSPDVRDIVDRTLS